tara:strand:+ start:5733 stop:5840 length:108 start_codon:yes stop_codon:yes gene_type:complete
MRQKEKLKKLLTIGTSLAKPKRKKRRRIRRRVGGR